MANGETTVRVAAWPDQPLTMNTTTHQAVGFEGDVPVCIRVCEPICARSRYTIGLTLFDRPVASVTVAGETVLSRCEERR